ncbi:hypothetical protein BGW39_001527 [Mortierella sp. 14UC]|nr:hypothetical protein BGW39_001527 [Mortierella sp. 14UC]
MATKRIFELYQRSLNTLALPANHNSDSEAMAYTKELCNTTNETLFHRVVDILRSVVQPRTKPAAPVGPRPQEQGIGALTFTSLPAHAQAQGQAIAGAIATTGPAAPSRDDDEE